jgi:hypothetical protein
MRKLARLCCLVLLAGAVCGAPALAQPDTTHWRRFVSSRGFEVRYPRTWFRYDPDDTGLSIASTRHVQAVTVIPAGAQKIRVYEQAPEKNDDYMKEFRESSDANDAIMFHKTMFLDNTGKNSCKKVEIFIDKSDTAPGMSDLGVEMYCKIGERVFWGSMVQWADDPYSQTAYDIALAMMRSLRADPTRPPMKDERRPWSP